MRRSIHLLASLRLTIGLLVVILVALATGTVVESARGAETAGRLVYGSAWFRLLLAAFAVNMGCSIVDLWPWGRSRIGYAVTHGSMLVILGGALTTELFKVDGVLPIWEGETVRAVLSRGGAGDESRPSLTLPFGVRLDAFEIDYYQGTRRPAQFRSRVTVDDPATGRSVPAVIEMNHELAYGGYRFFQSSYHQEPGRNQTILSVSKDPGQPIVFLGYFGLVGGMLTVLATRIADRRRAAAVAAKAAALVTLALLGAAPAHAQWVPAPGDVDAVRGLPVQHDGRVMPLDTVAREAVFQVTGKPSLWKIDPLAMTLGWTFAPDAWVVQPIVPISDAAVAEAIGLPPRTRWASFRDLAQNQRLGDLAGAAQAADRDERPLTRVEKGAQKVEARLLAMQQFFDGSIYRVIPAREPGAEWSPPAGVRSINDLRLLNGNAAAAGRASPDAAAIEVLYNRVRPSRLAWWVLVASLALSIAAWNVPRRGLDLAAGGTLLAGFAVMTWGIGARWRIAGHIPASNMYESLLFLAWGVGLFALVASLVLRNRVVVLNAAAMAALTMALTDLLPIDPFIHPMPPVLSGTYWLAVHVPIIMVGYSVLALGVVVAHMQIGFSLLAPGRKDLALKLGDLLYWYIVIGSILLIAGIFTGSMWAAESWGRYWGWDPKEVWSLVAFLAYMAILHARVERLIGAFGVAAWSIVAFQTILMTYLGVNFVLASGLHSYGFGESKVVWAMLAVAAAEAAFIGAAWARRADESRSTARTPGPSGSRAAPG